MTPPTCDGSRSSSGMMSVTLFTVRSPPSFLAEDFLGRRVVRELILVGGTLVRSELRRGAVQRGPLLAFPLCHPATPLTERTLRDSTRFLLRSPSHETEVAMPNA